MTTCLLIRHGQSEANLAGVLAGHLDSALSEHGADQARRVAEALRDVPLRAVVTSPLSRCRATAAEVAGAHPDLAPPLVEERLVEVRYGAWTGRSLADLSEEGLWRTVQSRPSAVTFPTDPQHAHEAMSDMASRAWAAWQDWDMSIAQTHGERAIWALVSHGDVIKAMLARALGLELDAFQSIVVDPASVSIVHRQSERTAVSGLNLREDAYDRLAASAVVVDPAATPETSGPHPSAGVVGGGDG